MLLREWAIPLTPGNVNNSSPNTWPPNSWITNSLIAYNAIVIYLVLNGTVTFFMPVLIYYSFVLPIPKLLGPWGQHYLADSESMFSTNVYPWLPPSTTSPPLNSPQSQSPFPLRALPPPVQTFRNCC